VSADFGQLLARVVIGREPSSLDRAKNGIWAALVQNDVATPANSKVVDEDPVLTETDFVAAATALRCDGWAIELHFDPLRADVRQKQRALFRELRDIKRSLHDNRSEIAEQVGMYICMRGRLDFGFLARGTAH